MRASMGAVRVLVVDDDEAIRESVRWLLEDAGCAVDEAEDGGRALEWLRAGREPTVVLLDWLMPRVDGVEVLEAVAADAALAARHAFILATANGRTLPLALAALLARLGVPVLAKPFQLDDVLRAVEAAAARLTGR